MTALDQEIEEVSPQMVYWIAGIILAVAVVYFTLGFMGIQLGTPDPAALPSDPSQFSFVCPLGAFH